VSRIFISHSTANNPAALAIARWLEELGWGDYFLDISSDRGLLPGERWQQALRVAADRCEAVLFLISPAWRDSRWCLAEFLLAKQLGKPVFGVLVDGTALETLPKEMTAEWQLCDLVAGVERRRYEVAFDPVVPRTTVDLAEAGLSRLKRGLQRAGVGATTFEWPPPLDPHRPPYRGLKPLDIDDAAVFFGREAAVVRGLDALRRLRERGVEQMLVIVAASGAGKSSYLRAGLWPRLKRDDRHFLPLPIVRPGRAVLTGPTGLIVSLEAAFKERRRPKNRADIIDALRRPNGLIGQLTELQASASETLGGNTPTVLIPIDQGEELFAAEGRVESEPFLSMLVTALLSPDPERCDSPIARPVALLGLRSESLGRFQEDDHLATVGRVLFELEPLPPGALKAVIEEPAERSSAAGRPLKVNPDLTEQLLRDAVGADALPLLAFTLERLFLDYGSDGELSLADYEALGRIRGAIEAAVQAAFDDPSQEPVIASNASEREQALRQGFIPWLAVVDPYTGERRRRVAKWDEIPPEAHPVFERLVKARLLIRDRRWMETSGSDTVVVEIAHEALLRQWPLLNDWLAQESDALKVLEDVRRAASEWAVNQQGPAWLIHAGERLENGRALLKRVDFVRWLGSDGRDYIAACHAREMAAVNEREAVRVEREQTRQREIDSAHRLAQAAGRVKRRSYIAAALALGVAISAGIAGVAFINARSAGEAARMTSIVRSAEFLADSDATTAALVLGTLPTRAEPEGVVRAAARALRGPIARAILRGHQNAIRLIAFSPDGRRLLTGSSDGSARVWNTDGTGTPVIFRGHEGEVEAGSFSPDGIRVVTAGEDETARVWRADGTGEPIVFHGYEETVEIASFSRDGTRVLTTCGDGTVRVWPADGLGEPVVLLTDGGVEVRAAFSPDGTLVVMGGEGGNSARIRRADGTGQAVVLNGHTDEIEAVAFSPDGRHVATASADKSARVWRVDGAGPVVVLKGHTDGLWGVAFSPDGTRVVTASSDTTARIWSADGAADPIVLRGHEGKVDTAAFSPDGAHIVTTSEEDGTARVWRADGKGTPMLLRGEEPIWTATFSPDSKSVATGDEIGTVRVWPLVPIEEPVVLRAQQGDVRTVAAVSPDGTRVLTVGIDRTMRLWHSDGTTPGLVLGTAPDVVRGIAFTADGTSVITATGDGSIRQTRIDGTQSSVLRDWDQKARAIAFSLDGRRFVTVGADSIAKVWSTKDRTTSPVVHQLPSRQFYRVAFSPDGERIIAADYNDVSAWRTDGHGEPVNIHTAQLGSSVEAVAVTSDGSRLATVNLDGKARIWTLPATQDPLVLRGYEGAILAVAFSPDGTQLVTGGEDGTARVWPSDGAGDPIVLKGHEGSVIEAIFTADGKHVVTGGEDGTTRIWRITWPDLLEPLKSVTTACLTSLQRRMYLGEEIVTAQAAWNTCEAQYNRASSGSPKAYK